MKRLTHQHHDVSIATHARGALFQPTRRPRELMSMVVKTAHGEAVVTGRIGQRHLDFLECARQVAEAQGIDLMDRHCCIVDPYKLRRAMNSGRDAESSTWHQLKGLARDLRDAEIEQLRIYSRPGLGVVTAGVLDSVMFDGVGTALGRCGRGRRLAEKELWLIPFSPAWSALIGADMQLSYRGHLHDIVSLRHGFSQAVARFMLSHAPGATYGRRTVLDAVQARGRARDRWAELRDDAEALGAMGVMVEADRVMTRA